MKLSRKVIIYSMFLSFLFLWIGTKSSPLYPMNDWVDANAFFTMGKGLMNGFVPYRDLFEQKGPILYFIYGIGYLISNKTFLGVFLIETVSLTIVLCYFYKILKLYNREKQFYPAAPFLLTIFLTMPSFTHGGSCEEIMLPCFAISFYHFLYLLKDKRYLEEGSRLYFWEGIIVGIILWTKFILLGFWIGWVIFIGILLLIGKQYKKILSIIGAYLLGILIVTVPILVYFGLVGSLTDLWYNYFYLNIFLYPKAEASVTLLERGKILWKLCLENMNRNAIFFFTLVIGIVSFLKDKVIIKGKFKIGMALLLFSTFFFNYIGLKNHLYYFFVMSPFAILFGITIANICSKIQIPMKYVTLFVVPILWIFIYVLSPNTYFINTKKEDLAQFIFADIMNQEENPTLLYYGNIDGGFYTIADIIPREKYFEKINIDYDAFPENEDSQTLALKEAHTEYVIVRIKKRHDAYHTGIPYLHENYEVIKVVGQVFENIEFKYVLLKRLNKGEVYEKRNNFSCYSVL